MPRHLTPATLRFETDAGGAGSPLGLVGQAAKKTQVGLAPKKCATSKAFGEEKHGLKAKGPTQNLGRVQSIYYGGRVKDNEEMPLIEMSSWGLPKDLIRQTITKLATFGSFLNPEIRNPKSSATSLPATPIQNYITNEQLRRTYGTTRNSFFKIKVGNINLHIFQ